MLHPMNLIPEHFIEHNVFRRPENIALHLRNGLLQCGDQLLGLQPLGIGRAVLRAARAVIRELAGALPDSGLPGTASVSQHRSQGVILCIFP